MADLTQKERIEIVRKANESRKKQYASKKKKDIVINPVKPSKESQLLLPKNPPGQDDFYISIEDNELPKIRSLLGIPGKKGYRGVLSFADDSSGHQGIGGGNPGYGGGNFGNTGSLGGQMSSGSNSPQASRGSPVGSSTSRASQSNIGGSRTGSSSSGSSSSHASSSNRAGPSGSGGGGGGGSSNRSGAAGMNAGRQNASTGSSGSGSARSGAAGMNAGRQNASTGSSGSGSARSGAAGMNAGSGPATSSGGGGGGGGITGTGGGLLGSNPQANTPAAPGMATPNVARSLLGSVKAPPGKIQDRILSERPEDRDPLSSAGRVIGSYMDPMNPVGLPGGKTINDRIIADTTFKSPSDQRVLGEPGITGPPRTMTLPGDFERTEMDRIRNEALQDVAISEGTLNAKTFGMDPYKALNNWAQGKIEPPEDPSNMSIKDWTDWQDKAMRAVQSQKLGAPSLAFQGMKKSTLDAAKALGLDIATTTMTPETQRLIATELARTRSITGTWDALNLPRNAAAADRVAAAKAAGAFGDPNDDFANVGMLPGNYNDPVMGGGAFPSDTRPGPGDLGPAPRGEISNIVGSYTNPARQTVVSPATTVPGNPQFNVPQPPAPGSNLKPYATDRVPEDPTFDPRNNPDYGPEVPDYEGPLTPEDSATARHMLDQLENRQIASQRRQAEIEQEEQEEISRQSRMPQLSIPGNAATARHQYTTAQRVEPQGTDPNVPTSISPNIPTKVRTVNDVKDIYGPDMDDEIQGPRVPDIPGRAFAGTGKGSDYVPRVIPPNIYSGVTRAASVDSVSDVSGAVAEETIAQLSPEIAVPLLAATNSMLAMGKRLNPALFMPKKPPPQKGRGLRSRIPANVPRLEA